MKIGFFVKEGLDSFLNDIIDTLSKEYETCKIIIKANDNLNLMDKWMNWADICWFEWCDDLIIYGSKLDIAKERKIICRLHSYEAFTSYPALVNWNNVDKLIFVAEHLQKFVIENCKVNEESTIVIPGGVNVDRWTFKERNPGYNIAYAGYVNYKKGPMLLLHTFKALFDSDSRYKLFLAGQYQDPRYSLYFQQMIGELGLKNNFFFEGWQTDLDKWLEDKNYILCTSLLESQNMSVMQSMAKGIKPVIHNFAGAAGIYPGKYLWNTIEEAVEMATGKSYDSEEYREFIVKNYSLENQMKKIMIMISELMTEKRRCKEFNYKNYWTQRLNSNFNIQGVGYLGLGEIYNKLLYHNRVDLLDEVLNKAFDDTSNLRVMELGPGIGVFTEYFHMKGVEEYDAVDIVEKAVIELSSKFKNYHFKQGDVSDSQSFEGRYHLILAADVLLHITNEDSYKKTIANIADHLEDDGICILFDPVSVINVKSGSPHVVIRNKEYIIKVLDDYGLMLTDMLSVANFMNYPFDWEVLGDRGHFALDAFNLISSLFSNNSISNGEKLLIGEYLLYREKQLLYRNNFGLSEKLLILQKKESKRNDHFDIKELLNIDMINENLKTTDQIINQNDLAHHDLFNKIIELVSNLEEGEKLRNDTVD
jgi:glycosyltransferase involved in cell wall biosynthesis/phospholipid N-methyltransferase